MRFIGKPWIYFGIALLLGPVCATWLINRYFVVTIEEINGHSKRWIESPLGALPPRWAETDRVTLWRIRPPESTPTDLSHFAFYGTNAPPEQVIAQLVVLTFESASRPEDLDKWYAKELGANFSRMDGLGSIGSDDSQWWRQVQPNQDSSAAAFAHKEPGFIQGVILQRFRSGTKITLYQFTSQ